jgi:hypothetical protein
MVRRTVTSRPALWHVGILPGEIDDAADAGGIGGAGSDRE